MTCSSPASDYNQEPRPHQAAAPVTRRRLLGHGLTMPLILAASLGGVTAGGPSGAAAAASPAGQNAARDPADLLPTSPEESLRGFMRLFAGIDTQSAFSNEGIIYGKLPDALPRPLFGFLAVLEIRTRSLGEGIHQAEQKEAMVCLELGRRRLLETWDNPYTGEVLTPVGYVSPVNRYFFTTTGSYMRAMPQGGGSPTPRDWRSSATDVWFTESRYNSFPSGISAQEFPRAYAGPIRKSVDILSYRASADDFADADLASVPSTLTMVSDTPWPLWMMMGKRPGGAMWHGFGQKYRSLADLPPINRQLIEAAYPGFLADPWAYPHAQWGTAAQLRRLREAGRLQP